MLWRSLPHVMARSTLWRGCLTAPTGLLYLVVEPGDPTTTSGHEQSVALHEARVQARILRVGETQWLASVPGRTQRIRVLGVTPAG